MLTINTCRILPKSSILFNNNRNINFRGVQTMQQDSFENNTKEGYRVNYVLNQDEYEGFLSFFLPNKDKSLLARYVINDSDNPPCYKKNETVNGEFSISVKNVKKANEIDKIKIEQNSKNSTYTEALGIVTDKIEDELTINAEGLPISFVVPNDEKFNKGDKVAVNGDLEFLFD